MIPIVRARGGGRVLVEIETRRHPLDHLYVRMPVTRDFLTGRAFTARPRIAGTFQCLRQRERERRLADRVGSGEEVGVRDAVSRQTRRENTYGPLVPNHPPV